MNGLTLARWMIASALFVAVPTIAQTPGNAPAPEDSLRPKKKPPPVNMLITVGQRNLVRVGEPMPVRVVLDNLGPPVTARLEVNDGRGHGTEALVELPRGAHQVYTMYAPLHPEMGADRSGVLDVRLMDGFRTLAREAVRPRFLDQQKLLLSCSADDSGLQFFHQEDGSGDPSAPPAYAVAHLLPLDMPREWAGYRPASVAVINGRAWQEMDDEQRRAMRIWIERGGRAILCGETSTEWRDPEGRSLAPITVERLTPDPELGCTRRFAGRPFRVNVGAIQTVTGPVRHGGGVLLEEEGRPLCVLRPAVGGAVLWLGFDPMRTGFREWEGAPAMWKWALRQVTLATPALREVAVETLTPVRSAAGALPRLPAPPLPVIVGFGILYALIFGPLNLWMLRRLRRTVRSWLWMPSLAGGMTVVVLALGQIWGQARTVLNRVSVLSTVGGSRTASERAILGLFSPTNRTFQLSVDEVSPKLVDLGDSTSSVLSHVAPSVPYGVFGATRQREEVVQGPFDWPRRQGDGVTRWNDVALQLFSVRYLLEERPRDLGGTFEVALVGKDRITVSNTTLIGVRDAYLCRGGRFAWIGDLGIRATARVAARDWQASLKGRGSTIASSSETLVERIQFQQQFQEFWRSAPRLVGGGGSDHLWLVGRSPDLTGGLDVAGTPYSNRDTLVVVRLR